LKKILFVIDNLGSGGAQNQLTMLAVLLKSQGYVVDVFYYYPQSFFKHRLDEAGIHTYFKMKKTRLGIEVVFDLIKLIRRNHYHVAISFLTTPNLYNTLAKLVPYTKCRSVISYRSSTDIGDLNLFNRSKFKFINSFAHYVVFNSYHERDNWIKFQPILADKSKSIYNVVDLELFQQRSSYQRKQKLLVIGSVGPDKNGLLVVNAIAKIIKEYKVTLTWTGQKVFELADRKAYIAAMETAIEQSNLFDFWHWEEPVKDVHLYYQNYDALILASKVEGLPNVVCEALSTGTPVILSNVLDHPILVNDGINGFLFDPNDADSLASAIKSLYSISDDEYMDLGNNARRIAEAKFCGRHFINEYKEVLNFK
jgi:glycosyltransferase involved in cell wall biosynthesis